MHEEENNFLKLVFYRIFTQLQFTLIFIVAMEECFHWGGSYEPEPAINI
jgi:hypothetical protein